MSAPDISNDLQLRRLRWRARRGLLENDVLLTRFLDRYETQLNPEQIQALSVLLDQTDNELLDLLLARAQPTGSANIPSVRALLALIQSC